MGNILISVIVPVYNAEKTLRRCIDNILIQEYTDFELLLIDDGSTDYSVKLCDEYAIKDSRVKVFHKTNGGVSSARNLGLDNISGEWVTFCDADDYVDCDWLKIFHNFICGDIDIIATGFKLIIDVDTKYVNFASKKNHYEYIEELEFHKILGFIWCKCFRTSIIKQNGIRFNEKYGLCEDTCFVYNYLSHSMRITKADGFAYNYFYPEFNLKYKGIIVYDCYLEILHYINEMEESIGNMEYAKDLYIRGLWEAVKQCYKIKELYPKRKYYLKRYLTDIQPYTTNHITKNLLKIYFHNLIHIILKIKYYKKILV